MLNPLTVQSQPYQAPPPSFYISTMNKPQHESIPSFSNLNTIGDRGNNNQMRAKMNINDNNINSNNNQYQFVIPAKNNPFQVYNQVKQSNDNGNDNMYYNGYNNENNQANIYRNANNNRIRNAADYSYISNKNNLNYHNNNNSNHHNSNVNPNNDNVLSQSMLSYASRNVNNINNNNKNQGSYNFIGKVNSPAQNPNINQNYNVNSNINNPNTTTSRVTYPSSNSNSRNLYPLNYTYDNNYDNPYTNNNQSNAYAGNISNVEYKSRALGYKNKVAQTGGNSAIVFNKINNNNIKYRLEQCQEQPQNQYSFQEQYRSQTPPHTSTNIRGQNKNFQILQHQIKQKQKQLQRKNKQLQLKNKQIWELKQKQMKKLEEIRDYERRGINNVNGRSGAVGSEGFFSERNAGSGLSGNVRQNQGFTGRRREIFKSRIGFKGDSRIIMKNQYEVPSEHQPVNPNYKAPNYLQYNNKNHGNNFSPNPQYSIPSQIPYKTLISQSQTLQQNLAQKTHQLQILQSERQTQISQIAQLNTALQNYKKRINNLEQKLHDTYDKMDSMSDVVKKVQRYQRKNQKLKEKIVKYQEINQIVLRQNQKLKQQILAKERGQIINNNVNDNNNNNDQGTMTNTVNNTNILNNNNHNNSYNSTNNNPNTNNNIINSNNNNQNNSKQYVFLNNSKNNQIDNNILVHNTSFGSGTNAKNYSGQYAQPLQSKQQNSSEPEQSRQPFPFSQPVQPQVYQQPTQFQQYTQPSQPYQPYQQLLPQPQSYQQVPPKTQSYQQLPSQPQSYQQFPSQLQPQPQQKSYQFLPQVQSQPQTIQQPQINSTLNKTYLQSQIQKQQKLKHELQLKIQKQKQEKEQQKLLQYRLLQEKLQRLEYQNRLLQQQRGSTVNGGSSAGNNANSNSRNNIYTSRARNLLEQQYGNRNTQQQQINNTNNANLNLSRRSDALVQLSSLDQAQRDPYTFIVQNNNSNTPSNFKSITNLNTHADQKLNSVSHQVPVTQALSNMLEVQNSSIHSQNLNQNRQFLSYKQDGKKNSRVYYENPNNINNPIPTTVIDSPIISPPNSPNFIPSIKYGQRDSYSSTNSHDKYYNFNDEDQIDVISRQANQIGNGVNGNIGGGGTSSGNKIFKKSNNNNVYYV